jgi:hypothetical protein
MHSASIRDARGVHVGLLVSLGGLYALLPMLGLFVWLTREPEAVVGWVLAVGALYLPLPFVTLAWICAVRARLGLSQPLRMIRCPQSVMRAAGGAGLALVVAIHGTLCWLVWQSASEISWTAAVLAVAGVGFLLWSTRSFVRTLRWSGLRQPSIAA